MNKKKVSKVIVIGFMVFIVGTTVVIGAFNKNRKNKIAEKETTSVYIAEVGSEGETKIFTSTGEYEPGELTTINRDDYYGSYVDSDYREIILECYKNGTDDRLLEMVDHLLYGYFPLLLEGNYKEAYAQIPQNKLEEKSKQWMIGTFESKMEEFFSAYPEEGEWKVNLVEINEFEPDEFVYEVYVSKKIGDTYYTPENYKMTGLCWDVISEDNELYDGKEYVFCPANLRSVSDSGKMGVATIQ